MHLPLIEIWDPDVSGDVLGLAMAALALLVALALVAVSARAIVRSRRARHPT